MAYRTPPIITPFAILSMALALGATNVVTNSVTKTNEGAPRVSSVSNTSSSSFSDDSKKKDSDDSSKKDSDSSKKDSSDIVAIRTALRMKVRRIRRARRLTVRRNRRRRPLITIRRTMIREPQRGPRRHLRSRQPVVVPLPIPRTTRLRMIPRPVMVGMILRTTPLRRLIVVPPRLTIPIIN